MITQQPQSNSCASSHQADFTEITLLIASVGVRTLQVVNTTRTDLCWQVGQIISQKIGRFEPEYIGKLNFYLEALDWDIKKPHEQAAIGVLLCASKSDEVVEHTLRCNPSSALIAQYHTRLPDKALLQAKGQEANQSKLHEFYLQNGSGDGAADKEGAK